MNDLIGIPFVNQGRDRNGMDCWGLALAAMKHFGKDVPDIIHVSCFDSVAINVIYGRERERWAWLRVDVPQPGDLAVMRLDPDLPDTVQHVGVYVGDGRVLHTMRKRASHLIRIDDPFWKNKVKEFYRWEG